MEGNKIPWREGFWKMGSMKSMILQTNGSSMRWKNLVALDYPDIEAGAFSIDCQYGNFGEARKEIFEATTQKDYNFQIESIMFKGKGVMNAEGTKITIWGLANKLEEWEWMDEKMIEDMKEDRDPFEAPSCPHIKPQPGKAGKILWLSGPPGAGKSTTCQLLARNQGFSYYEADCTGALTNPFTDIHVDNPSLASFEGKPLKGVPRDLAVNLLKAAEEFSRLFTGKVSKEDMSKTAKPYYKAMADDIARQKKRLGGTFAVAHAVATRSSRDDLRKWMGPELIFVVLNMTKDCQLERLQGRHGDSAGDVLTTMHALYEPAGEDEENSVNVTIEKGMSKDEVMNTVLDKIKPYL